MREKILYLNDIITHTIYFFYIVTTLFYLLLLSRFCFYKFSRIEQKTQQNVAILACFKNESKRLSSFIDHCVRQAGYNRLYLVNDYSTDNSESIVRKRIQENASIVLLQNLNKPGKKNAFTSGMAQIDADYIVCTDVDCLPISDQWLRVMSNGTSSEVVLGYAPFYKRKGWLNAVQRYEVSYIGLQYFACTLWGIPYMGVGRNMSFSRKAYEEVRASINGQDLISGDDDLLVQAMVQHRKKITIACGTDSYMYSNAEGSYKKWLRQKSRQISTSLVYPIQHQILLTLSALSEMLFWPITILLIVIGVEGAIWFGIALCFTIRWCIKAIAYKKLASGDLSLTIPVLEAMYGLHLILLSIYSLFQSKRTWK